MAHWVRSIGAPFAPYAAELELNFVNGAAALLLSEADLTELGIKKRFHRLRLLGDIAAAVKKNGVPPCSAPSKGGLCFRIPPLVAQLNVHLVVSVRGSSGQQREQKGSLCRAEAVRGVFGPRPVASLRAVRPRMLLQSLWECTIQVPELPAAHHCETAVLSCVTLDITELYPIAINSNPPRYVHRKENRGKAAGEAGREDFFESRGGFEKKPLRT